MVLLVELAKEMERMNVYNVGVVGDSGGLHDVPPKRSACWDVEVSHSVVPSGLRSPVSCCEYELIGNTLKLHTQKASSK